jgi:hypothetical protein
MVTDGEGRREVVTFRDEPVVSGGQHPSSCRQLEQTELARYWYQGQWDIPMGDPSRSRRRDRKHC